LGNEVVTAPAIAVGFTSTVAVIGVPIQVLVAGVMVNVTVTGILVVFVKFPLMFPLPLDGIPVTLSVLSLVQLKVVAAVFPETTIVAIGLAEQIVCTVFVAIAFGLGFIVTAVVLCITDDIPQASVAVTE